MTLEQLLAVVRSGCIQLVARYGMFDGEYQGRLTIISPSGNLIPDEIVEAVQANRAALYLAALHSYTTICPSSDEHRPSYRWLVDPRDEDLEHETCEACIAERKVQLTEMDTRLRLMYN